MAKSLRVSLSKNQLSVTWSGAGGTCRSIGLLAVCFGRGSGLARAEDDTAGGLFSGRSHRKSRSCSRRRSSCRSRETS
ncbi:hypothetical protein BJY00DRAFT_273131 [Aspergillus carlsbadensis]|nr:hypothetical protein BJY00DRAFT_273131 [Aspergillus carlsbadensis]